MTAPPTSVTGQPATATAVVPLRDGRTGKTRLAEHLPAAERGRLVVALARHVVATLLAADGVSRVLVVTADPAFVTDALDADPRLEILTQPSAPPGLNAAVEFGREQVRRRWPGDRLLVIHADLPALTTADVAALLAPAAPVTLGPDRAGLGTNAVLLRPGTDAFTFAFGPDSLARHRHEAQSLGSPATLVRRDGTAIDLDTEADFSALDPFVQERLRAAIAATDLLPRLQALP
ncbi:2-phospho-L-lactate guanylyltransferase [Occultella aeris]|uniref:Phosphoenolpyruvate guanylyltransferase n=1 Tax=Occultella aeris TaxID=2761496 RepID=A0A7M4DS28_9MICO|nr:2-phospho-L-lactate guanylyltransferase [Occultella aeris]VZO40272.1 2-phospho-L-lactate guanylyltransferase [Occultella aeris]